MIFFIIFWFEITYLYIFLSIYSLKSGYSTWIWVFSFFFFFFFFYDFIVLLQYLVYIILLQRFVFHDLIVSFYLCVDDYGCQYVVKLKSYVL